MSAYDPVPISNKSCDVTRVNEIRIVRSPSAPMSRIGTAPLAVYAEDVA